MYYVYELIDPRVNLPFYVGKGKGNRVYFHLSEQLRAKSDNARKFNKIQKMRKEGYEPEVKIIQYFENENDAYDLEDELIKKYGRIRYDENGILTNICESSRPPNNKGRTYQEIYGDKWEEQIEKRRQAQINVGGYDHHNDIATAMPRTTLKYDKAFSALLTDLKQKGLLESTLVIWGGEFGRTVVQGGGSGSPGRDHNGRAFSIWMAGGNVKGGIRYGETDELGARSVKDKVHIHDLHATILHLMGFDHTKLTYNYNGREFRLTDVYGNVIKDIVS